MNAARLWIIGGAAAIAGVILLAWFAGVQPKLTEAANAESLRVAAVEANAQNEVTLAQLKEQYESIDELRAELAELQIAVPFDLGAPDLLAQVYLVASANGVAVQEFTLSEARAYGSPAPAAPPAEEGAEPADSEQAAAEAEPPTGSAPLPPPAVTDPRITAGNFVAVPASVTLAGPQSAVLNAVQMLQHGDRLFLVNGISLSPVDAATIGPDAPYTASLSGFIYVLLDPTAMQEQADEDTAEG